MARSATKDAQDLFHSLRSAYAATPTNLKIIDLYVIFAVLTAIMQVAYMAIVGSFPFNSFLSGVLSCVGTAVLAVCLRIQVNKENKEFKDLPPERAFTYKFTKCITKENEKTATKSTNSSCNSRGSISPLIKGSIPEPLNTEFVLDS